MVWCKFTDYETEFEFETSVCCTKKASKAKIKEKIFATGRVIEHRRKKKYRQTFREQKEHIFTLSLSVRRSKYTFSRYVLSPHSINVRYTFGKIHGNWARFFHSRCSVSSYILMKASTFGRRTNDFASFSNDGAPNPPLST